MTEAITFDDWKAMVEYYLILMVKKSINDLSSNYDLTKDFEANVSPKETATRIIQNAYQLRSKNAGQTIRE